MEEGGMSQATIVKFMATKTTFSITWANREKIHGSPGGGEGERGLRYIMYAHFPLIN